MCSRYRDRRSRQTRRRRRPRRPTVTGYIGSWDPSRWWRLVDQPSFIRPIRRSYFHFSFALLLLRFTLSNAQVTLLLKRSSIMRPWYAQTPTKRRKPSSTRKNNGMVEAWPKRSGTQRRIGLSKNWEFSRRPWIVFVRRVSLVRKLTI